MKLSKALFALVAAGLVGTLSASPFYVAGGVYSASVEESFDAVSDLDLDDNDTVPALFFGVSFMDHFAVEAGYYDLGSYSSQLDNEVITADSEALAVNVVGSFKVVKLFDLYGKFGLAHVTSDLEFNSDTIEAFDDSSTDPYYGVGANLNVGQNIDIYAEYVRFASDLEVDLGGVGIRFHF
ncbi:outer membrane beta-barrel protein [Pelagicoccus albus]|uniref:Outer membrane beta-barrel protein n=1 Tax=Pelagicoccus albus TaxID=415222 RepID=A0A7X1E733_9BACT|nr:outer membrane beta-barrel protein [Pelagicoccus albus]MBC2604761.1 outer membrane beta-barrel protein [Pelagicoccus albus]